MILTFCTAFAFCSQGKGIPLLQKPYLLEPNCCNAAIPVCKKPEKQEETLGNWILSSLLLSQVMCKYLTMKVERNDGKAIKQHVRSTLCLSLGTRNPLPCTLEVTGVFSGTAEGWGRAHDMIFVGFGFFFFNLKGTGGNPNQTQVIARF